MRPARLFISIVTIIIAPVFGTWLHAGPTAKIDSGEPIPVESFARAPLVSFAVLSPDGRRVAFIRTNDSDRGSLLILDLDTNKLDGIGAFQSSDIYDPLWSRDGRILFQVSENKIYAQGLYVAKLDKLDHQQTLNAVDLVRIIGRPRNRPSRVLTWIYQKAFAADSDSGFADRTTGGLVELDLNADVRERRLDKLDDAITVRYPLPKGTVTHYLADFDGEAGLAYTFDGNEFVHLWNPSDQAWHPLALDHEKIKPLGFDPDRTHLWVVTQDASAGYQLRRFDLATLVLEDPVYTDPAYDLSEATLQFSARTRQLVGLRYDRARERAVWLSPRFAALQDKLKPKLPADADSAIIGWDDDENRFLIRWVGPSRPPQYVVYDAAGDRLIPVGGVDPGLADRALTPTTPIAFKARDGLSLEGYLTLPAGISREHPAPLVVLAHGGPWVRDTWDYDPDVQFLANCGYAVLQPNYRGSSGYSPAISTDQAYDFPAMRDDVIDSTRAILASGIIDPKRVAIMGGSFGGYLALACATAEPDLYHAAISECGVFDWAEQVRKKGERGEGRPGEYNFDTARLGDPDKDRKRYEAISIFNQLDRLKAPVFLAHGLKDTVVSVTQTRRLASELRRRDHPVETFYRVFGGHGFARQKDRADFYREIERFLARYIPSDQSPVPSP